MKKGTHAVCPYCLDQVLPVGDDGEIYDYCVECECGFDTAYVKDFDKGEIQYATRVEAPHKCKN